ncbi:HlyD family type I secretion periplasmic adaptor subunit [Reinekea sp. G2M2-21]|uniref:HlyD family type I secretion periplasmic adaptor subunit n=1 Tax=Reinekea sp. G2M2-21 TaxID=2788942 RepID=UPI0018AAF5D1|nr:HlyD family type I secretion periplasmic adaptor subunit [Reinekea sp. G2M2-21]
MKFFNKSHAKADMETYQFMPAALSVQATPPNPLSRWLARALSLLLIIGVAWACIGTVNIVVSADGKILPTQRVQYVQPYEKSTVTKIYVKEGELVTQGQPLVELNSISVGADLNRIQSDLYATERKLWVKQSYRNLVLAESNKAEINLQPRLVMADWYRNRDDHLQDQDLLNGLWRQYHASLQGLSEAMARVAIEQQMNITLIEKLQETVPLTETRFEKVSTLYKYDGVSEMEMMSLQQELTEATYSLQLERERKQQLQASYAESVQRIAALTAQTNNQLLDEIIELRQKKLALLDEQTKAEQRLQRYTLNSPVDGVVQNLVINTLGGVVTDAEKLMTIVPEGDAVEVEVFIANQDIGFVHEGMSTEVKIHTLPFTKYGIVDAEILSISSDAILDEKRGLVFSMLLKLKKSSLYAEGRDVKFKPGMAVTAEIQTGNRRLIEFFLSPLMRMKMESLRER